jgi:hypothetical protein
MEVIFGYLIFFLFAAIRLFYRLQGATLRKAEFTIKKNGGGYEIFKARF